MAPSDLKTQSLHGVLLTFISGSLSAVLSSLIRWYSERSQYSVPNILLHICLFQLVFALISCFVLCDVKCSIKKTVNSIHSIQNIRYITYKTITNFHQFRAQTYQYSPQHHTFQITEVCLLWIAHYLFIHAAFISSKARFIT
eukprot:659774_1